VFALSFAVMLLSIAVGFRVRPAEGSLSPSAR
jgi:hypothetical protein